MIVFLLPLVNKLLNELLPLRTVFVCARGRVPTRLFIVSRYVERPLKTMIHKIYRYSERLERPSDSY